MQRIAPAEPPFPPEIASLIERITPPGLPPFVLFTTAARDPRLFKRWVGGNFLGRGNLTVRQREVIVLRVTGQCGSEYEWGIHVSFFRDPLGLTEAELRSTVSGRAEDTCWTAEDAALIRMCDQLNASCNLDERLWNELKTFLTDEAILEALIIAGIYRTGSCVINALRLPLEAFGARFPAAAAPGGKTAWSRAAAQYRREGPQRIASVRPPYEPELATLIQRIIPPGVAPFALFTVLARDMRLFRRWTGASYLGRGNLTVRQREIVIDRVTGICGSEYEWGLHVSFFREAAGFTGAELASLVHGGPDDPCWNAEEAGLIRLCDQLNATCDVDQPLWDQLKTFLTDMAILEAMIVGGSYRTVAYMTNALRLPLETFGTRFPPVS